MGTKVEDLVLRFRQEGQEKVVKHMKELGYAEKEVAASTGILGKKLLDLGKDSQAVGNELKKTNPVFVSFNQIVQDAPFGIRGVGNNIQFLTQQFTQLRASGMTTRQILGGMMSNMLTPMGGLMFAVSAGTSLLTVAMDALGGSSEDTAKKTDELNQKLYELGKIPVDVQIGNIEARIKSLKEGMSTLTTGEAWGRFWRTLFEAGIKAKGGKIDLVSEFEKGLSTEKQAQLGEEQKKLLELTKNRIEEEKQSIQLSQKRLELNAVELKYLADFAKKEADKTQNQKFANELRLISLGYLEQSEKANSRDAKEQKEKNKLLEEEEKIRRRVALERDLPTKSILFQKVEELLPGGGESIEQKIDIENKKDEIKRTEKHLEKIRERYKIFSDSVGDTFQQVTNQWIASLGEQNSIFEKFIGGLANKLVSFAAEQLSNWLLDLIVKSNATAAQLTALNAELATILSTAAPAAVAVNIATAGAAGYSAAISAGVAGAATKAAMSLPTFHDGGIVGRDVPIIAQRKEMFLNDAQQANLFKMIAEGNGGGRTQPMQITLILGKRQFRAAVMDANQEMAFLR